MQAINPSLAGKKIWVTRPARQSAELCEMIQALQGVALRVPTVEICPVRADARPPKDQQRLAGSNIVVFISKNAVIHTLRLFPRMADMLRDKTVLAAGRATAECLTTLGLNNVTRAEDGGGTEALLQLPGLSGSAVRGRRVLIIRGQGGREALRDRLATLGADVDYLEVYRREKPDKNRADMQRIWRDEKPDAVIVTSLEGLNNLVDMTPATKRAQLYKTVVIVMSERIKQHAAEIGFTCAAVAEDNSDAGLLDALVNMNEDS